MYKTILTFTALLFLFSCANDTTTVEETTNISEGTVSESDNSKTGRSNYAVVWKWATSDASLVNEHLAMISNEFTEMYNGQDLENAYYDAKPEINKLENFPNVTFFLKSKTYEEAEAALNKLTIVQKGIATYTIHPVGTMWLGRKAEVANAKGTTKCYVAVWSTPNKEEITDELTKSQSDAVLALYNNGTIENVYFDLEATQNANEKQDFVFFVNANSENEAQMICDELPFTKANIASYKLHSVGVFWLGTRAN